MSQKESELLVAALRFKPAAASMVVEVSVTTEVADLLAATSTGPAVWASIPPAPFDDLLKRLGN